MTQPAETSIPEILESPEEVLTTLTKEGKRRWMYPVVSKGKYLFQRRLAAWALIALYLALPLVRINNNPAVLLDFINRQFALFGLVFYPTDTVLLMIFIIGILLSVILFTSLLGRVWCGWACPQTVYMEFLFRPIERWIEGAEHVRKRRNDGPFTFDKAWRKSAKMVVYLGISLILAHTFVAYFVGWDQLWVWIQSPPISNWGFFLTMAATTGLILFDFGYFREQMCTIACPYARMQSVLLDKDSLIVSYDPNRGEPRAKRSKKKLAEEASGAIPARGDCIDCFACVRTCPTGIDIRDGLQMECIACTQCIDACDSIMDRIGKPRGLVRYTSENQLSGRTTHLFRPRTIVYSILLVGMLSAFSITLSARDAFDIDVGRVTGDPFTVLPDGRVANRLRFRVRNQTADPVTFTLSALSPEETEMQVVGTQPIPLDPGQMTRVESWILIPRSKFEEDALEGIFELAFSDGSREELEFMLLGPTNNGQ